MMTRPTSKMTGNPFFSQLSEHYLLSLLPANNNSLVMYEDTNDTNDINEYDLFTKDLWNATALMGGEL